MPIEYAAGVSMGDGSALVCGGMKSDDLSNTAECNYVDTATLDLAIAPPLPEPLSRQQVHNLGGCLLSPISLDRDSRTCADKIGAIIWLAREALLGIIITNRVSKF